MYFQTNGIVVSWPYGLCTTFRRAYKCTCKHCTPLFDSIRLWGRLKSDCFSRTPTHNCQFFKLFFKPYCVAPVMYGVVVVVVVVRIIYAGEISSTTDYYYLFNNAAATYAQKKKKKITFLFIRKSYNV